MNEPIGNFDEHSTGYNFRQRAGWGIGLFALLFTLIVPPPEGLSIEGWRTAGVTLLMATFWICESIPIPATALIPLVLFPILDLGTINKVIVPYSHPIIFLFLGGFLIALSMQKWHLHRRVAITLLTRMGTAQHRIIAGFLLASALISMWVSNTATALMMLPIAISVTRLIPADKLTAMRPFILALMLSVAYGSTTGGMATLIGTPPNALLAAYAEKSLGIQIGFAQWMIIGIPVALASLGLVYVVLTRFAFRIASTKIEGMQELLIEQRATLGPITRGELTVAIVFLLTASGWILRPFIDNWFPMLTDTTIAIAGALMLFCIPVDLKKGAFALDWETAKGVPWDVLLLFGGGLSLAGAIETHQLAEYLGNLAGGLSVLPIIVVMLIISFGILMLTELTSNTATAATFLPVVAAVAVGMDCAPLLFLVPTALAANCSYMMPVGTPPNAIVFGSGMIRLPEMVKAGFILNLIMVPIIVLLVLLLGNIAFGIKF